METMASGKNKGEEFPVQQSHKRILFHLSYFYFLQITYLALRGYVHISFVSLFLGGLSILHIYTHVGSNRNLVTPFSLFISVQTVSPVSDYPLYTSSFCSTRLCPQGRRSSAELLFLCSQGLKGLSQGRQCISVREDGRRGSSFQVNHNTYLSFGVFCHSSLSSVPKLAAVTDECPVVRQARREQQKQRQASQRRTFGGAGFESLKSNADIEVKGHLTITLTPNAIFGI